jgi:hypothetical protein
MELSLKNRLILLGVLPVQGNMVEMLVVKGIREVVDVLPTEAEAIGLKATGDRVQWDTAKEVPLKVTFNEPETELVRKALTEMDAQRKLTLDHLDLYKLFVGDAPKPPVKE